MPIRTDAQLKDGTYGTTNPITVKNTITAERHRDIIESKVSRYSIQNPDDTTPEGKLILSNNQHQVEQDKRIGKLETLAVKSVNGVKPDATGDVEIKVESNISVVLKEVEVVTRDSGIILTIDSSKAEIIVDSNHKIVSGEILMHDFKIALSNVKIGNEAKFSLNLPLPEGYELADNRGVFIAACDAGGTIYPGTFAQFKARTGSVVEADHVISIPFSFYTNINYPSTVKPFTFGDIRIKFI